MLNPARFNLWTDFTHEGPRQVQTCLQANNVGGHFDGFTAPPVGRPVLWQPPDGIHPEYPVGPCLNPPYLCDVAGGKDGWVTGG